MGAASGYLVGAFFSWMFGSVAAGGFAGALPPVLAGIFFKHGPRSLIRKHWEHQEELRVTS